MSGGGGGYNANPQKMRETAQYLLSLAERPKQIREETRARYKDFEGWNGRPGAVADSFYEQTQPEQEKMIKSLTEPSGIDDAMHGAVSATLTTADSIDGAKGFADDLVKDAKAKAESVLNGDESDGDDSGYESGDSDHTGGGKH
ncbi:hypothetical protein OHS81_15850 [Streptomyces sp. NBC_00400]|uniref:hypothetical protein n=1 Tax=Streptomyces sp. NBC_00400 TaxID=2975737 RepID=UPI002E23231C